MPQDFDWRKYPPLFYYKPQAYLHSCFSACLQMALVNFGLIPMKKHARITEDEFNNFMIKNDFPDLDTAPPNIDIIDNFLLLQGFTGGERLSINIIEHITDENFQEIQKEIDFRGQIAIIGSIAGGIGGHANALVKCKGMCYGINPLQKGTYFMSGANIALVGLPGDQAIRIQRDEANFLGAINHCWIIHPGV